MSEPLFEQYKAALRRGHMAALDGRLDEALEAYRAAQRLVPERALPLASQGTVLHRLDRWTEALAAFDRALALAPDDEAALRARAIAHEERGDLPSAAADLQRLAFVLDVAGRAGLAAEAAAKADALDPTPARRALAARLARSAGRDVPGTQADAGAAPAVEAALAPEAAPTPDAALDDGAPVEAVAPEAAREDVQSVEAAVDPPASEPGLPEPPAPEPGLVEPREDGPRADGAEDIELLDDDIDLPPPPRIVPETDAEVARANRTVDPATEWPQLDLPSPPPAIVGPPPDPLELMAQAAELVEAGNTDAAADRMLTAVLVHRDAGRLDAALDTCLQLLEIAPGDPHVHLAIANLELDHGWTALAREKIDLLLRLTELTGDTQAEADVHGLAAERLRDDPVSSGAGR